MKRLEISLMLAVIFCAVVSFLSFEGECAEIRGSVLRLHILANSDSDSDQQAKLLVRDAILEASEDIFAGCGTYDEAVLAARRSIPMLTEKAEQVLRANGIENEVRATLADSYFSTRTYGEITLPAGIYEALRIEIGSAAGQNWWCVMFPTVCLPTAAGEGELEGNLSPGQVEIVCGEGYELRFRCVELYEQFMEELRNSLDGEQK